MDMAQGVRSTSPCVPLAGPPPEILQTIKSLAEFLGKCRIQLLGVALLVLQKQMPINRLYYVNI